MLTLRQKLLSATVGTLLLGSHLQAQDFSQQNRDLNIMSGIFQTVLQEDSTDNLPLFSTQIKSLYLADQGMVFTINAAGNGIFTVSRAMPAFVSGAVQSIQLDNVVTAPTAAAPTVISASSATGPMVVMGTSLDYDRNTGATTVYNQQASQANTELQAASQALMEQQAQVQQLQASLREEQAQMQKQAAQREAQQQSEVAERLSEVRTRLEGAMSVLNEKRQELSRLSDEERARRAAEQTEHAQETATTLISVLCDYGSALRSLKNDEHVTLVLENFSEGKSRVMVFNARDVKDCNNGENLGKEATVYDL